LRDNSLKDPHCVYQLLRQHYARYAPEKVCEITGTPIEHYMEVARTFCGTGRADRAATIMYAIDTTQHTTGTDVRSSPYCNCSLAMSASPAASRPARNQCQGRAIMQSLDILPVI
jgi:anaerobic selenocysteine-containing dehydrogenase